MLKNIFWAEAVSLIRTVFFSIDWRRTISGSGLIEPLTELELHRNLEVGRAMRFPE
jgi:hypothetical protein